MQTWPNHSQFIGLFSTANKTPLITLNPTSLAANPKDLGLYLLTLQQLQSDWCLQSNPGSFFPFLISVFLFYTVTLTRFAIYSPTHLQLNPLGLSSGYHLLLEAFPISCPRMQHTPIQLDEVTLLWGSPTYPMQTSDGALNALYHECLSVAPLDSNCPANKTQESVSPSLYPQTLAGSRLSPANQSLCLSYLLKYLSRLCIDLRVNKKVLSWASTRSFNTWPHLPLQPRVLSLPVLPLPPQACNSSHWPCSLPWNVYLPAMCAYTALVFPFPVVNLLI